MFPPWLLEGQEWTSLDKKLELAMVEVQYLQCSSDLTRGIFQKSESQLLLTRRELVDDGGRYYHQEETSRMVCTTMREEREDRVVMVIHETRGW